MAIELRKVVAIALQWVVGCCNQAPNTNKYRSASSLPVGGINRHIFFIHK